MSALKLSASRLICDETSSGPYQPSRKHIWDSAWRLQGLGPFPGLGLVWARGSTGSCVVACATSGLRGLRGCWSQHGDS